MSSLISCASTPRERLVTKTETICPDSVFYADPIDAGISDGANLEEIMSSLSIALGQANRDRQKIKEYCDAN